MCGFAGIFAHRPCAPCIDEDELLRMREAMVKRGPDGAGNWISSDRRVGLAHRRLSIIDLSEEGSQPMISADGSLVVVFNGEIYNYKKIRAELEKEGRHFRSQSDTEVLLHLYETRGKDMVHALRGMFAFAIWDSKKRGLFIARDPFGIKPLYYSDVEGTIRIASQVKVLLTGGNIGKTPSPAGHVGFYLMGYVPEPYTLYNDIRSLNAGSWLWIGEYGHTEEHLFHDVASAFIANKQDIDGPINEQEVYKQIRQSLADSVKHHLVADVPVGIFLSSGLDSCSLAAIASELSPGRIHTITLGFDEYRGTKLDETAYAEAVAARLGTVHQTRWIGREEFLKETQRLYEAMDQPSIDGVNTYFVSKVAAESGLKVALSGLGGDELFGSYPSFRDVPRIFNIFRHFQAVNQIGKTIRGLLSPLLQPFTSSKYAGLMELGGTFGGAYMLRRALYMPWEILGLMDRDLANTGLKELDILRQLDGTCSGVGSPRCKVSALELKWYMRGQLLRDADWAGMAHSLEIRVPYIDREVIKEAALLTMVDAPISKRNILGPILTNISQQLVKQKKRGFTIPIRDWLVKETRGRYQRRGLRGWAIKVYSKLNITKRVLVLVSDAFGGYGGIAKFNRDLINAICSYSEVKEVVCIPRHMPNSIEKLPAKLEFRQDSLGGKIKYMMALRRVLQKAGSFDLVICGHINLLPAAHYVRRKTGAPIDLIIHGIDAWNPTNSRIVNMLIKSIDGVISVSNLTADRFSRWSGLSRDIIRILPNSIDRKIFCPGPKSKELVEKYGLGNNKVIMTLGRMESRERYKGFDEVLDIMPELIREYPGIIYLAVGDGSDKKRLEKKADILGVISNVIFTGMIPETSKVDHYRLADVYVMPSRGEGFGIVYLEAMGCGVPVIGSNIDGSREALRNGELGILVDPSNPKELVSAIKKSLGMSRAIVPPGLSYFDYNNCENNMHAILEVLL